MAYRNKHLDLVEVIIIRKQKQPLGVENFNKLGLLEFLPSIKRPNQAIYMYNNLTAIIFLH